jgi:integrase
MKKRADGRYRKIVDGKAFYGVSEREVYRKVLEYTNKAIDGLNFEEIAKLWWDIEVSQLSPSTVRGYQKCMERAVDYFGKYLVKEISAADITRFLNILARQKFCKKTVKNHKIIVSRILHFATIEGYISSNPARDAELPRNLVEKKRKAAPMNDEAAIKSTDLDDWQLPVFALLTGMRKGELIGLKWQDINLAQGFIKVSRSVWYGNGAAHEKSTKTEAGERIIPIVAPLHKRLTYMVETGDHAPSHFVFGNESPLSEKAFRYRYKKYCDAHGITCTLHQLRKSFATAAVEANIPPDVLKQIIGHADISTTLNIYNEVRGHKITAARDSLSRLFEGQDS